MHRNGMATFSLRSPTAIRQQDDGGMSVARNTFQNAYQRAHPRVGESTRWRLSTEVKLTNWCTASASQALV